MFFEERRRKECNKGLLLGKWLKLFYKKRSEERELTVQCKRHALMHRAKHGGEGTIKIDAVKQAVYNMQTGWETWE